MEVIVVEDDELLRDHLAMLIENFGRPVACFESGEQALSHLASFAPPSILVTDIDLGRGMDGFSLGSVVRARCPDTGVIYITGRPWLVEGRVLGPHERFLAKPFRATQLIGAIDDLQQLRSPERGPPSRTAESGPSRKFAAPN
jgi:two-component system, OmpR family, response regulator